jgi:hypothetical protein
MHALRSIAICSVALFGHSISNAAAAVGGSLPIGEPAAVDIRPIFDNWGLTTRPQGSRGTCSAFVVTGALEYALATQRRAGAPLSVEFLNWASNDATRDTDDGGFFSDLWKGYTTHGICALDSGPTRPSAPSSPTHSRSTPTAASPSALPPAPAPTSEPTTSTSIPPRSPPLVSNHPNPSSSTSRSAPTRSPRASTPSPSAPSAPPPSPPPP